MKKVLSKVLMVLYIMVGAGFISAAELCQGGGDLLSLRDISGNEMKLIADFGEAKPLTIGSLIGSSTEKLKSLKLDAAKLLRKTYVTMLCYMPIILLLYCYLMPAVMASSRKYQRIARSGWIESSFDSSRENCCALFKAVRPLEAERTCDSCDSSKIVETYYTDRGDLVQRSCRMLFYLFYHTCEEWAEFYCTRRSIDNTAYVGMNADEFRAVCGQYR